MKTIALARLLPSAGFAAAALAASFGCAAPAVADTLNNLHPKGCFASVARAWNARAPQDLVAYSTFADRFEGCASRDKEEVQVRSDLVGWYKSELGLTMNYLEVNQRGIAKRHYDRAYAVLDRMVTLAQKSGDVALGRYVTESSERLYEASGIFESDGDEPSALSERNP